MPAIPFEADIDLNGNQILNVRVQLLASDPSSPTSGMIWFNSTSGQMKYYNGSATVVILDTYIPTSQKAAANGVASLDSSSLVVQNPANAQTTAAANKIVQADSGGKIANGWLNTGSGNGLDADQLDGQHGSHYLSRSNHTGTQTASTISDLATVVKAYRLDEFASPTSALNLGGQRLTNGATPTSDADLVTKAYADALAGGFKPLAPVRVATTANINLSSPGASIDGVPLSNGDEVLVKNQTAGEQNGPYVWNGAAAAMTRRTDFDSSADAKPGSTIWVNEGTAQADTGWALTTNGPITLDTTALTFTQYTGAGQITAGAALTKSGNTLDVVPDDESIEISSDALRIKGAYRTRAGAQTIGDGSATTIDVTHGFGTNDIIVQLWKTGGTKEQVVTRVEKPDTNTARLIFTNAPANNSLRVVIFAF